MWSVTRVSNSQIIGPESTENMDQFVERSTVNVTLWFGRLRTLYRAHGELEDSGLKVGTIRNIIKGASIMTRRSGKPH